MIRHRDSCYISKRDRQVWHCDFIKKRGRSWLTCVTLSLSLSVTDGCDDVKRLLARLVLFLWRSFITSHCQGVTCDCVGHTVTTYKSSDWRDSPVPFLLYRSVWQVWLLYWRGTFKPLPLLFVCVTAASHPVTCLGVEALCDTFLQSHILNIVTLPCETAFRSGDQEGKSKCHTLNCHAFPASPTPYTCDLYLWMWHPLESDCVTNCVVTFFYRAIDTSAK